MAGPLRSYLRYSFGKNRFYTVINIVGLAIALACLFLVSAFVFDEYSFDRYHRNADRIYRVVLDFNSDGTVTNWAKTSAPIGEVLTDAFPEIDRVVRIRKNPGTDLLAIGDVNFYEDRIFFADSALFNVFDFKAVGGDLSKALKDKNSMVLSRKLAVKFYGTVDVVGKAMRLNNEAELKITAIIEDMPANSHFVADAFVSFSTLADLLGERRLSHWGQFDHYTYVLLTKGSSPAQLQSKLPELLQSRAPEWVAQKETLYLQPLNSIHLQSHRKDEIRQNSKEIYSYILITISLLILLMASANFVNISTATLIGRYREIAIRKILGADRAMLTLESLTEAITICGISALASLALAYLFIPTLNAVTNKEIAFFGGSFPFLVLFAAAACIGLASGLLSALNTARLKESKINAVNAVLIRRSAFRNGLVGFQFFISLFLIICAAVVWEQNNFLRSMSLGFNSEKVLVITIKDRDQNDKAGVIANELSEVAGVGGVSFSSSTPGTNNTLTYTYSFPGTDNGEQALSTFLIDENLLDLYRVELAEGRALSIASADTLTEVMVNEAAAKAFNLKDPIGQTVSGKVKGKIVGVVKDFNHSSLHQAVQPLILYAFPPTFRFVSVRLETDDVGRAIAALEEKWREFFPAYPMEFVFLDDQNATLYRSEFVLRKLYAALAIFAISIAGVGLVGLVTYTLERKEKEISIRKVFGGSSGSIVRLIYSTYVPIVSFATVAACALAYIWMQRWLTGFVHRADLEVIHFALPALLMLIVLFLTTGLQSVRAAHKNPIDNLRQ